MLNPMTAGNFYKKYEKPSDYPELSSTFDYQFKGNKLVGANENISLSGPIDYTVVGSPSIVDGVLNYTSFNDYLSLNEQLTWNEETNLHIYSRFKTPSSFTDSNHAIISTTPDSTPFLWIWHNYIFFPLPNTNVSVGEVTTNTWYRIEIISKNNVWTRTLYDDNNNVINTVSQTITTSGSTLTRPLSIFRDYNGNRPVEAVDLNETYIKINDQLWFGKKYRKKTLTKETIPVPANFTVGSFTTPCNGMFNVVDQSFTPYADYPIVKTDSAMLPVSTYNVKGKNAYTVIGSPTINNGVVSNFDSNNYLTVANSTIDNELEIQTKILPATHYPSQTVNVVTFGNAKCGITVSSNGNTLAYMTTSDNGNAAIGIGQCDTTIFVRLVVKPSEMQVYKSYDNGSTFTLLGTLNVSVTSLLNEDLNIGKASVSYDGSIDLKETYVKANGEYWFKPYPTPVPQLVGPVTYTIYGNPTIVDGIVSNTNRSNHIRIYDSFSQINEEFEIGYKFTTPSTMGTLQNLISFTNTASTLAIEAGNTLVFLLNGIDAEEQTANVNIRPSASYCLTANTTYYVIFKKTKTNLYIAISTDKVNWTTNTKSIPSNIVSFNVSNYIVIGGNDNFSGGTIDLNETYIKVNGSLWFGKETWQPSRYEDNAMYMLVGHKADYSKYNNLGFAPTITNSGTFDLWLDNQKVQSSVASSTNLVLQWDKLALTTGYTVSTPEALKAHTLKVVPTSSSEHIEQVQTYRVDSSIDNDEYGTLWYDFNLENEIKLNNLGGSSTVTSPACQLVTAKNDEIKFNTNGISYFAARIHNVKHLPTLNGGNKSSNLKYAVAALFNLPYVKIKNVTATDTNALFNESRALEKITLDNVDLTTSSDTQNSNWFFKSNYSLKQLPLKPNVLFNSAQLSQCLTQDMALYPTDIDLSFNETANKVGIYGISSRRMDGVKSLLLSPNAPLGDATAPQVDVSYTGLDRNALHNLFASLPLNTEQGTVKTVNITGATGADELLQEDIDLLTELGWTQTGGTVIEEYTQEWLGDNPTNSQIGDIPIDSPNITVDMVSMQEQHLFTPQTFTETNSIGHSTEVISTETKHLFTPQTFEETNNVGVSLDMVSAEEENLTLS